MMAVPKISIVTPVFNGAKYLEDTILSVIQQGYPNLEYIIIDGGSTDGSVDIIKKYESHLAYWVSEPDTGLYHAVQKGFEKSTGDIMAWINSDDMYQKGAFSIVEEIFSCFPHISWLMGIPSFYDERGRTIAINDHKKWCKAEFYLGNYQWIQQESIFWRRSLWNQAGSFVNTSLKYAGDFELWLRFFRHAELYTLHALLAGFRMGRQNQLSIKHIDDYHLEAKRILEDERQILPPEYLNILMSPQNKIGLINKILNKNNRRKFVNIFNYPKEIIFDRFSQRFVVL